MPGGLNPRDVLRSAKSTSEPQAAVAYQELLKARMPEHQYRSGSNQAPWMGDNVAVTASGFAAVQGGTTVNYCATPTGALTFSGADLPTWTKEQHGGVND